MLLRKIAHRDVILKSRFETLFSIAVETHNVFEQTPCVRTHQITALSKKGIEVGSAEFKTGHIAADTETHVR